MTRLQRTRAALLFLATVLLALASFHNGVAAQDEMSVTALRVSLNDLRNAVEQIKSDAFAEDATDASLAAHRAGLERASRDVLIVAVDASNVLKTANQLLTDLGAVPESGALPESEAVAEERQRLNALRAEATLIVRDAELLSVQVTTVVDQITSLRRQLFVRNIFERTPITSAFWDEFKLRLGKETKQFNRLLLFWTRSVSTHKLDKATYATTISLVVAGLILAFLARFVAPAFSRPAVEVRQPYLRRLFSALWIALLPSAAISAIFAAVFYVFREFSLLPGNMEHLARIFLSTMAGFAFLFFLTRAVFAPNRHNWRLFDISEQAARRLSVLVTIMSAVYALDYFITQISEVLASPVAVIVGKSFFATLLIALILSGIMLTRLQNDQASTSRLSRGWAQWFYWPMWCVIGLLTLGVLAGFVSFGKFLSSQVVVTGAILITMYVGILSGRAVGRLGALRETRLGQYLAGPLKFSPLAVDQFGMLAGMALYVAILVIGVPIVLLQWGFQRQDVQSWVSGFFSGFSIGDIQISFGAIALAIAALAIGLIATRIIQRWVTNHILARTRLDSGIKNSVSAGIGYLGTIIAIILALEYTGVDLSSLALIVGALSVGIGFGLQNVVNNFVSGIILLIERPIRVGDWIVVGDHEGYVKKISVRATEVETFDRKSVIIPNADLINTSVSNWMLKDSVGRLIIDVGVSYDANEEQVREILYQIVESDERIATHPEPYIYFKDFGDSALIFQIRVFLRDVNDYIRVAGDSRFAIRKAFREAGIEIPFPQRDIHMTSVAAQADAPQVTANRRKE